MRVLFTGTSELGIPTLEALAADPRHETVVLTKPDQVAGRGRRIISSPIKKVAEKLGLVCRTPVRANDSDFVDAVNAESFDLILVASYWARLSEAFLSTARFGGVNIHPSLLPRYRGAAPIQHALLNGDPTTGVTLFAMEQRMDAGGILVQVEESVRPDDDYLTLHDRLARRAAPLALTLMDDLEAGRAVPRPQDEAEAVAAPKLSREDGLVDWSEPAAAIERKTRAFHPWPGAYTFVHKRGKARRLLLIEAKVAYDEVAVSEAPGTVLEAGPRLVVACGRDRLEIRNIQQEGKKAMDADAFLRGRAVECGTKLG